ncbi:hypothetical protein B0T14DRAFT_568048 [Immersiella caudata]|uniref:Uncharacterized protein n=1 Tax=Immersiella caudata TaxID=314043 RepID=A0AA40BWR7_9PEZI|nr:hypothetical protein B0T14DRAFT_568048 [Immersiella caudata]
MSGEAPSRASQSSATSPSKNANAPAQSSDLERTGFFILKDPLHSAHRVEKNPKPRIAPLYDVTASRTDGREPTDPSRKKGKRDSGWKSSDQGPMSVRELNGQMKSSSKKSSYAGSSSASPSKSHSSHRSSSSSMSHSSSRHSSSGAVTPLPLDANTRGSPPPATSYPTPGYYENNNSYSHPAAEPSAPQPLKVGMTAQPRYGKNGPVSVSKWGPEIVESKRQGHKAKVRSSGGGALGHASYGSGGGPPTGGYPAPVQEDWDGYYQQQPQDHQQDGGGSAGHPGWGGNAGGSSGYN